jgi:hypothetical protein
MVKYAIEPQGVDRNGVEEALIHGQRYTRWGGKMWKAKENKTPDTQPDVICECGNDTFRLHYGSYEITATCTTCGFCEAVYDG